MNASTSAAELALSKQRCDTALPAWTCQPLIGSRDRRIIAALTYASARVGAIAAYRESI
jgi:hypothetical protein